MADDTSHAAWLDNRAFEVRLIPAEGPERDLITGFTDFLAAVDFVIEWLDREDSECASEVKLVINQVEEGVRSEVFSYPPSDEPGTGEELIRKYGFNPAAPRLRPNEHPTPKIDRLSTRIARPPETRPSVQPPPQVVQAQNPDTETLVQHPEPPVTATDVQPAIHRERPTWPAMRNWVVAAARLNWDDRAARGCLIVAALSAWLAVALADATFLLPLVAAGAALWLLHRRRPIPDPDADEWL